MDEEAAVAPSNDESPRPTEPRRRRRWMAGCLPALAVMAVIVLIVVVVVRRNLSNQTITNPPNGVPLPTNPPVTIVGSTAVGTSFSIVQQPWGPRAVGWTTPPDLGPDEKVPLVVLLHGLGESSELVFGHGSWASSLVEHRFIVETPTGQQNSWNAGGCCFPARTFAVDDVAFLDSVLDDALTRPNVDPDRIFMVGESNGGMMTYRYACTRAARLTAMASVSGTNVSGCQPGQPISVLDVHGTLDDVVPYGGGLSLASVLAAAGTTFPPVQQAVGDTATAMGCGDPVDDAEPGVTTSRIWSGCTDGATVELLTITGGRHQWFNGEGVSTTDEILRFFGIG